MRAWRRLRAERRGHRAPCRRRRRRGVGALLLIPEAGETSGRQRRLARRALRFGLQSWGANLLQQINYRFDVLILGAFAGASDVGVYSVALTLTSVAWVLPQALQTVLFPRVASLDEAPLAGEITSRSRTPRSQKRCATASCSRFRPAS